MYFLSRPTPHRTTAEKKKVTIKARYEYIYEKSKHLFKTYLPGGLC